MRILTILFLLLLTFSNTIAANDIRTKVANSKIDGISTSLIEPDSHIYGIPWNTTEDEFVKNWGEPVGYIRFDREITGMLYGKRHMFLFKNKKLSGLKITHSIIDWQLSQRIQPSLIFDSVQWKLNNGIKEETDLATVKQKLGDLYHDSKYEKFYETTKSKITLNFSHYTNKGNDDSAYRVHSILVELKKQS